MRAFQKDDGATGAGAPMVAGATPLQPLAVAPPAGWGQAIGAAATRSPTAVWAGAACYVAAHFMGLIQADTMTLIGAATVVVTPFAEIGAGLVHRAQRKAAGEGSTPAKPKSEDASQTHEGGTHDETV